MQMTNKYFETSVQTTDKSQIVVMLYNGAIKFLKRAVIAIENNDFPAKGQSINKAIDIINELNFSLDMETGGEIADNLRSLYNFFVRELTSANIKCDIEKINSVINCLQDLNKGWSAIAS